MLVPTLATASFACLEVGHREDARPAAQEVVDLLTRMPSRHEIHRVFDLAWVADKLGVAEGLRQVVGQAYSENQWVRAFRAVLDHDLERAAEILAQMGNRTDEAQAHLKAAEKLLFEERPSEAQAHLRGALDFYRPRSATRNVRRAEALLMRAELEASA